MIIERMFGTLGNRHRLENAAAQAAQNAADIEYIAMMLDVSIDTDVQKGENDEIDKV